MHLRICGELTSAGCSSRLGLTSCITAVILVIIYAAIKMLPTHKFLATHGKQFLPLMARVPSRSFITISVYFSLFLIKHYKIIYVVLKVR